MREHPIPQDITGYKFHIIGSMTLKQFIEIALGVGLAGIIYTTNLPGAIKWPLIIFSAISGGLVAFLPIEERPLDHWIITFIRVMYKPTQFFWKREAHIPEVFNYKQNLSDAPDEFEIDLGPVKKERIREYLTSVPSVTDPYSFDSTEVDRMNAILGSFSSVQTTQSAPKPGEVEKPKLGVRVRNLRPVHKEEVVYSSDAGTGATTQNQANATQGTITPDQSLTEMYTQRQQLAKQQQSTSEVAEEVAIPETELIAVVDQEEQAKQEAAQQEQQAAPSDQMVFMGNVAETGQAQAATDEASYNANLPFPEPPTEPNKVVGMVLSPQNDLIVNAIIEILKPDGSVARAVKTNALGQFFITTPLASGDYTITVDKDGYSFEPQHIQLIGERVQPIEIRSLS